MTKKDITKLALEIDQFDDRKVHFIQIDNVLNKILILGRGDFMYFHTEGKSTIVEISARFSKLSMKSLKYWHDGKPILDDEKNDLANSIKKAYQIAYKEELELV